MKKILVSFSLFLFTAAGLAQTLKPVKIDSLVTISLPVGYQVKDTLDQHIYSGNGTFGYMVVIRAENAKHNPPLKKERDLNNVLKDYIKGIKGQSEGNTMNVRDTTVGRLKAKTFTLAIDQGAGVQLRNFILIYTQETTYTIEYYYEEARKEVSKDEYKEFSSSIRLSPELQRNDQYLSNAKGLSPLAKYALFGGVPLIIILIIIFAVQRRKRKSAI